MPSESTRTRFAEKLRQMELLHTIGLEIVSVLNPEKLLPAVARNTKKILGYDNCAIFVSDGKDLMLKAAHYYPESVRGKKIQIGEGIVGRCAQSRKIINIPDTSRCSFYIPSGLRNIQAEIAVPIVFGEEFLGVLTIESTRKEAFSVEDERTLSILASQFGAAMHNADITASKAREMKLLHEAGLRIVSKMDLDRLLSTILNLIRKRLGYGNCAIFLPEDDKLILRAQSRFPKKIIGLEINIGEGIVGRCAQKKRVVNIPDVSKCSYYIPSGLEEILSAIAMPILFESRLMGVLATESSKPNAFGENDLRLLSILCSQIGVALRNAEMHEELKRKVVTDGLTGLYNHRYFITRLEQESLRARRYRRPLSLILIDIDNFKLVNDIFGHLMGDEVLIAVARIILDNIRKTDRGAIMKDVELDIPVRYGGEEFMIILPETPLEGAFTIAERMRNLIKEELNRALPLVKENGEKLIVTGSIGVAHLLKDEMSGNLIKRVDQAMYEAKRRGKDRVYCMDDSSKI